MAEASRRLEAPAWLRERISAARAERGKMYQLAVLQGYLEVTDWAYFLRTDGNRSLMDDLPRVEALFERVFARSSGSDPRVRIVTSGRAEHFVLIDGAGILSEVQALELPEFAWTFDPDL